MSIPAHPVDIPDRVRALVPGMDLSAVWLNDAGGVTFRGAGDDDVVFVKLQPRGGETSVAAEVDRLRWASSFAAVPEVRSWGGDATHEWLVTTGMAGESAVSERGTRAPRRTVRAIGAGLRQWHERLPVDACPFTWEVPARIGAARARGIRVPAALHDAPAVDRLVVCHGDACAPNTLIDADGRWVGHVDVGASGRADRWADIAVAVMSLEWNFGPGWDAEFFAAYGIEPDPVRQTFYRALWNAT
ncbi:aminoglycoside 3'-phosphotransferase [Microbacterium aurantiacum]|uniref:Aminoglycoside phosphotransferase n=1 Tax=Microbacterium aurantiacum TaxID=162393 RepID=A0A0M8MNW2_9MICO|nr:aminoglycoside 3'-phosphotransferase [Microbacterium chocolatum]ANG85576.1 aminoglycoside phosphotransferase APH(3') [Microbacterium chocolatum]KOS11314.1 aminoglycoside phosphotransferase [Microbacterium chocolatum]